MKKLRFAVSGTGFWTRYQILARMELSGVEFVALYNRTKSKAEVLAQKYNVPSVYDSQHRRAEDYKGECRRVYKIKRHVAYQRWSDTTLF